jgi:hypothetical protein
MISTKQPATQAQVSFLEENFRASNDLPRLLWLLRDEKAQKNASQPRGQPVQICIGSKMIFNPDF